MKDRQNKTLTVTKIPVPETSSDSRRRFLTGAGGALGWGAAVWILTPALAHAKPKIEFINMSCGEPASAKSRVLVAYASKAGSTGGVAEAIGKELCAAGAAVDVRLITSKMELQSYDAVIVGAPSLSERWQREARNFVSKNQEALGAIPVAYFITCLKTAPGQPYQSLKGALPEHEGIDKRRERVKVYLKTLLRKTPKVKPVAIEVFSGALDYSKLSPAAKTMLRTGGYVEGDFRDWERIRGWAKGLAPKLLGK